MLSHANILANAQNTYPGAAVDAVDTVHTCGANVSLGRWRDDVPCHGLWGDPYLHAPVRARALLRALEADRITHTLIVPVMVNMLVHHPNAEKHDLSSVRQVLYGASPMPEPVICRALAVLPKARFTQAYGQSEASPVMTLLPHQFHCFEGPDAGRMKSAGRAVIGCEIRIHDRTTARSQMARSVKSAAAVRW